MVQITTQMITELRAKTSAGMMDCKTALVECNGDFEAAVDWLRKKGLVKAGKKSERVAASGLVSFDVEPGRGVIVEVNCETDFVAKNIDFQNLVRQVANSALVVDGDLEKTKEIQADAVANAIATIGENIQIRRTAFIKAPVIASYLHTETAPRMGKIVVLVGLEGDDQKCAEVGRKVAMHVAASKPDYLDIESVPSNVVEKERDFQREQSLASGKPADIVEKMLTGRIQKFYEEIVLLEQPFVMDPAKKVKDVLEGCKVTGFKMLILGDGVEKKQEDYASEVASMLK